MQPNFEALSKVTYLIGSSDITKKLNCIPAKRPFSDDIIDYLNDVSREIMRNRISREYSDVITFGFWIRKGSTLKLKERFSDENEFRIGKGSVFHIAPSNVPVIFAYSLVAGLLCGNSNIVRVPSKGYPQVDIIIDAFNKVLGKYPELKTYIICIRYERDKIINDMLSSVVDMRVVWGGDKTISEIRKSPLPPRSGEITFADRYSIAFIDSDAYMNIDNKLLVAEDFYNDTFFSDQNACTSPRIVIWTGNRIDEAKELFWKYEQNVVEGKYVFQPIQGVNKLTKAFLIATRQEVKVESHKDNRIIRVKVDKLTDSLMDYYDNSGFFYEYDCKEISDLKKIIDDKRCQTVGYIGNPDVLNILLESGIKGIDRIVPIGKTMDFDLIWDGYNLPALLTRIITIV